MRRQLSSLLLALVLGSAAIAAGPSSNSANSAPSLVGSWLWQKIECSSSLVKPVAVNGQLQSILQELIVITETGDFKRITKISTKYTEQGQKLAKSALLTLQKKVDKAQTVEAKDEAIAKFQKLLGQYDSLSMGKDCVVAFAGKQSVKNGKLVLEAQTVSSDCPVIPAPSKFETSYDLSGAELKFTKEKDSASCKNKEDSSVTQFTRL
jgi:hypothetical protein